MDSTFDTSLGREPEGPSGTRRFEGYGDLLARLSHQSVVKHFDAYADVAWDSPEFRLDPSDPRLELPSDDSLGATAWYRSLPAEVRSRLGLHIVVDRTKTGLQFESVLKRGLLAFADTLPDGAPELRYVYHEVIEEAQHSLMFQELIRRSGCETFGLRGPVRWLSGRVVTLGSVFPELFFIFVLGGEEPVDHIQRAALRDKNRIHPLIARIMQIHVIEEARHLCFAQRYLRERVPGLDSVRLGLLQVAAPVTLGLMAGLMGQPSPQIVSRYAIPKEVIDEAYTHNPAHRERRLESLRNVRKLCEEIGLLTPRTLPLWRALGVARAA